MFVCYKKNHMFSFTLVFAIFSKDCVILAEDYDASVITLQHFKAGFHLFRKHRPSSPRALAFNAIQVKHMMLPYSILQPEDTRFASGIGRL